MQSYVVTSNDELFELVVTLIWLYLAIKPRLGFGLDSSGLGLGLGICWTRYRSECRRLIEETYTLHL